MFLQTLGLFVTAFALAAAGQKPEAAAQSAKVPPLPPELQTLHGLAMAAPPEFTADALLRIAASPKLTNRAAKRELIERAFEFASRAQYPYERDAVPGTETDTRSGFLASAYQLRLDAISLQARSVIGIMQFDPKAGVRMFSSIPHPSLEPLTCDDALVPDMSGYYAALEVVAAQGFTDADDRTRFLLSAISRMTSHAEVSPMARAIGGASLSDSDALIVITAFATKAQGLPADARTFSFYSVFIGSDFVTLTERLKKLEGGAAAAESLDQYLAKRRDDPACGGNTSAFFGQQDRVGKKAKVDAYWQSAPAKKAFEEGLLLRYKPNGSILSDTERSSPEWGRRLTDYLASLESWRPGDEASEADYYHQRAVVYEALVELAPAGPFRDKLLQTYVAFVTTSSLQSQSPVEWYWHARSLTERMRQEKGGAEMIRTAFRQSGNVILSLEAGLEGIGDQGLLPSAP